MRSDNTGWSFLLAGILCISLLPLGGCGDDEKSIVGPQPEAVPAPVSPENLIEALQVIYNDELRSADERLQLYQDLFPPAAHDSLPGFIFHFQPVDVPPGGESAWGLDAELQAHQNMFGAQGNRDFSSLELTIQYDPPTEMQSPEPGQENWQEILASNVLLRLMFNPQDGLLVDGGQAIFRCAPADGRWYVCEWEDLARPFAPESRADAGISTWGRIKSLFD